MLQYGQAIILQRDCEAVLIPDGTPVNLKQGSAVYITQALGGSYTVNINSNLARIAGENADALGLEPERKCGPVENTGSASGDVDETMIWEILRTCYDPEIPINIVELGLIYECNIQALEDGNLVTITMTLTAPGCGMGEFLAEDVSSKVSTVPNVSEVKVNLTFDPPWDQTMMSEAARLQTGLY